MVSVKPLYNESFFPLYEMMNQFNVPILIHPMRRRETPDYPGEDHSRYWIWQILGWPYESTVAMTRLVFSGVFDRYPDLKIKPFKPVKSSRDEEDLALIISDPHIDKVTESYNLEVARDRFDYLLDGTMTIINLHRPIRKVHIFMLGDIVQGENAFQGSKVGETLKGVYEQIHDDAVPILSRFVTSLAQGVKEIDVYGVRGNHGRYAKEAPDKTNWDSFFYKALAGAMVNQKGINV